MSEYYQFITFRTADSTDNFLLRLAAQGKPNREKQMAIDEYLDTSQRGAHLHGDVLRFLFDFIKSKDGVLYSLVCFAIMPNHVHLLIKPLQKLPVVVKRLKGASAKGINELMGRRGNFWEKNYYDKAIRDEHHFRVVYRYIKNNPLKLGTAKAVRPELGECTHIGGASSDAQIVKKSGTAKAVRLELGECTHIGGASSDAQIAEKSGTAKAVRPELGECTHIGGASSDAQIAEKSGTADAVRQDDLRFYGIYDV